MAQLKKREKAEFHMVHIRVTDSDYKTLLGEADVEQRTVSAMTRILLHEAIEARNSKPKKK